jgi:hypothetical protein
VVDLRSLRRRPIETTSIFIYGPTRVDAGHNIALQIHTSQLRVSQRGLDDGAPGAFA